MVNYNRQRCRENKKLFILVTIGCILRIIWQCIQSRSSLPKSEIVFIAPVYIRVIDPDAEWLNRKFPCSKSKQILNIFQTTLCRYASGDTVSGSVSNAGVWEESDLVRIMKILVRHPQLDMIDIGANIGGYTMFTAGGLGRLTIAIDCYLGNIERIARAAQLEHVQNRVVLIHNALYSSSGKSVAITTDDPSGMRIINETLNKTSNNPFVVSTIRFDEILPLLEERHVTKALIKIDVETSESYLCETGAKVFDRIDIPYIMMEWHHWRVGHQRRYQFIVDFLTNRTYIPTDGNCNNLNTSEWLKSWPGNVFWIKSIYRNDSFCGIN